jgi:hypothetical protein
MNVKHVCMGEERMQLKFDNFEIDVKKYIVDKDMDINFFITDSEVKTEDFNIFLEFYFSHNITGGYFRTMFSDDEFYGRFGHLIYSKHEDYCKMRLVFVPSEYDQKDHNSFHLVSRDVEYENLLRITSRQEIILDQLKIALEEKNLFSRDELERVFSIGSDAFISKQREITCEVKDLAEYLHRKNETLEELEQSY